MNISGLLSPAMQQLPMAQGYQMPTNMANGLSGLLGSGTGQAAIWGKSPQAASILGMLAPQLGGNPLGAFGNIMSGINKAYMTAPPVYAGQNSFGAPVQPAAAANTGTQFSPKTGASVPYSDALREAYQKDLPMLESYYYGNTPDYEQWLKLYDRKLRRMDLLPSSA